jgi:uncharacterized protein YceH (UPF0502 family)
MSDDVAAPPKWTQLEALERRVLGVLIEKAKTTPDVYPLTLKGLVTGSNQKSNRFPQMEVDEDRVADALEELRKVGAVAIIQGDGRVEKYRHLAYEWLGVDKVEMAVMAELLLRGAQTIGELRGRAARMEPIKGLDELGPILQSLQAKSLIVYLTPPGRGAVITHNLYQPREIEKVRREHGVSMPEDGHPRPQPVIERDEPAHAPAPTPMAPPRPQPVPASSPSNASSEVTALREEVAHLRTSLSAFRDETEASIAILQEQLTDLNRQLGN